MQRGKRLDLYRLSRKKLLQLAREKGIANAGVLTKLHIVRILSGANKREIEHLIRVGKQKWRAGWGKRGGRPASRRLPE